MIRLEKRVDASKWLNFTVPVCSFLAALVAGAVLIASSGNDPFEAYSRIIDRSFTSEGAFAATLLAATPLLFTGLAAAAAFRMGVFNIGGEGQFFIGAITSSWVGLTYGESLGAGVIPLMMIAGVAGGAMWAAIPGALKAFFNTSEIITSLMLNYVAASLMTYLIFNTESTWRLTEGSGLMFPQGRLLDESTFWPFSHIGSVDVPFGFWVGTVVAVLVWILYRKTRFGFEVDVISDAAPAAAYAGMRTRKTLLGVMGLSGGLAGLGGASDIGDIRHLLDPKGLEPARYGYTGIVIAALARLNPLAVVPVSILMGALNNAGRALQGPDFPAGLVGTLQGLILFFALGGEVFARYRVRVKRSPRASAKASSGDVAVATGAGQTEAPVGSPSSGEVGR